MEYVYIDPNWAAAGIWQMMRIAQSCSNNLSGDGRIRKRGLALRLYVNVIIIFVVITNEIVNLTYKSIGEIIGNNIILSLIKLCAITIALPLQGHFVEAWFLGCVLYLQAYYC